MLLCYCVHHSAHLCVSAHKILLTGLRQLLQLLEEPKLLTTLIYEINAFTNE